MTEAYAATSFIVPEILTIPEEKLNKYLEENKDLQLYRQFFREILRQKSMCFRKKKRNCWPLPQKWPDLRGKFLPCSTMQTLSFPL